MGKRIDRNGLRSRLRGEALDDALKELGTDVAERRTWTGIAPALGKKPLSFPLVR